MFFVKFKAYTAEIECEAQWLYDILRQWGSYSTI